MPPLDENKRYKAALWYAKNKGWPVLALHTPNEHGTCSCKDGPMCSKPGKHPRYDKKLLAHGCHSGTTDPELIKKWWMIWPDANVGISTGKKSFDVLDVDTKHDGPSTLEDLESQHGRLPDTIEQITGSGGRQIMFRPTGAIANEVSFARGLDTRSDGGLVVVPPSLHFTGNHYEWEVSSRPSDNVPLADMPLWLLQVIGEKQLGGNGTGVDTAAIWSGIEEGRRDESIFRYACQLRARNLEYSEAWVIIQSVSALCKPPFPEKEAKRKLNQAWKYAPGKSELDRLEEFFPEESQMSQMSQMSQDPQNVTKCHGMSQSVTNESQTFVAANYSKIFDAWLDTYEGDFHLMHDTARELGWDRNPKLCAYLRKLAQRAVAAGKIAPSHKKRSLFRKVVKDYELMDLESVVSTEFPIVLPLGLNKLSQVCPKEIILVAGETDAGKTAFIFNILWVNLQNLLQLGILRTKEEVDPNKIGLRLITSEMGKAAIRKKVDDFGPGYSLSEFNRYVACIERKGTPEDIIDPTGINCIDYLEPPDEGGYAMLGPTITSIFSRLTTGVAVVALQKKTGTDVARGGEATLEKPRLAVAISKNKERGYHTVKITKGKQPRPPYERIGELEKDILFQNGTRIIELSGWDYANNHAARRKTANFLGKPPQDSDNYYGE